MKRLISLALSVVMLLALTVPTASAAEEKPVPPDWVKAEEYVVFSGDTAYQPENWARILRLREDAEAGNQEPQSGDALYADWNSGETAGASAALRFELGLVGMKYAENSEGRRMASKARRYFSLARDSYARQGGGKTDSEYYLLTLWYQRARLLECRPSSNQVFSGQALAEFLQASGYTMEQFRNYSALDAVTEAEWAAIGDSKTAKAGVNVTLDGGHVDTEGLAVVKNGRTMIPIRCLAELLGADVSYDQTLKAARIARAGTEIVMPIGSKTATVNGEVFQMDVAPYIENGRTMIPARYVSEWFGQKIQWVAEENAAAVQEDKSLAGDTNLESWALAMGAVQNYIRAATPMRFGGRERCAKVQAPGTAVSQNENLQMRGVVFAYEEARYFLSDSWGINSREDLIKTVCSLTYYGHNGDFLSDVAVINALSAAEYQALLKNASGMDVYMFPYTKQLGEKWGERGILAWDLFRISNLVQWGYESGYVTYPEALALLKPAVELLRKNFQNWDEAYDNYLDGYYWWARENMLDKDPWTDGTRGTVTGMMLRAYREKLMDDTLFETPVNDVPGVTAQQLFASVQ